MKAEVLVKTNALLGEGSWFDWEENKLIWVDIWGKKFHVTDPETGADREIDAGIPVTTIAPSKDGYIIGTDRGVMTVDKDFGNMKPYNTPAVDYDVYRCNDGKAGPDGKFWIGLMEKKGREPIGRLYVVDDKQCVQVLDNLSVPNGIVWDEKRSKMYYTHTKDSTVYAYDYHDSTVSNPEPVYVSDTCGPDGMTIDEYGNLWVAVWGSGRVCHVDPVKKEVIDFIEVAAPHVSSTAIHNGKIYITTSCYYMTDEEKAQYPLSGCLFVADVPVNGIEQYRYKY